MRLKYKYATVKIYAVEFCNQVCEYSSDKKMVYSNNEDNAINYHGTLLIREDEIEKYQNYGGGIKNLALVGVRLADEPTCNCGQVRECKCSHEESEPKTFVSSDSTEENVFYTDNKEDPDAFVLKFIPENGGESCAEITYHNGMYSLVGTVIELQENSEIGLNGSKVHNKFLFRRGGDTEFMPITYQQAREIKDELEE